MNKLYLVGNHIGNIEDFPKRSVDKLQSSAMVLYESIEQFSMLVDQLNLKFSGEVLMYGTSEELFSKVRNALSIGDVSLITDLGYPMIADVGYPLAKHLVDNGYEVSVIPGPTISAAANIVTVFDHFMTDFMFQEFMGLTTEETLSRLEMIKQMPYNLVMLDHPQRLEETLEQVGNVYGNRPSALVFDLTLPTERVVRAKASELKDLWVDLVKDIPLTVVHETTIVVRGYREEDEE
jgi:16S rRNA (cytidine1402-2'-O)-methyltransferase